METYDFKPILDQIIIGVGGLLVALLTALVGFGISWLRAKTRLLDASGADKAQQVFSEQITRLMAYAETVAGAHIPSDGKVSTDNPFLKAAYEYALRMYPDTVGKLDFDQLGKAIVARVPSGPLSEKADEITLAKAAAPAIAK